MHRLEAHLDSQQLLAQGPKPVQLDPRALNPTPLLALLLNRLDDGNGVAREVLY